MWDVVKRGKHFRSALYFTFKGFRHGEINGIVCLDPLCIKSYLFGDVQKLF
jgi:hypothetical protein